ncbi:hypothetical protein H7X46_07850 [Pseudonocardia sp. C8]|uniref:hypothetical protein n=1 Tax=Pseudonocardia sp. C8 TaxID=2762759 RepID=UPI001642954E|nr:hypothetical protein [Pseudonocardia sp. C8]MBC3190974.1 hypothetical protein [Pseudonocardia sp. C8]
MPEDGKVQGQYTLGNDDIHVQYRNKQDLVRQAISFAQSRADDSVSPDGAITMPARSFRMVVEALRMTYKTLGETIHQDLSATTAPPSATAHATSDKGLGPAVSHAEAEVLTRFNSGKPRAREALRQATLHSEYNEDAFRHGDQISIPLKAFQDISAALIESNDLMSDILRDQRLLAELRTLESSGPRPDHGDYGSNWDPWNTGDWFTTH